jgi:site-specific DNA-adenine methylase
MAQTIKCFNEDIIELIKSGELQKIFPAETKKNLIYLDPPYGGQSSDYPKLYSFLEEYIHLLPLNQIEKIQKFNRYAKTKGYNDQFIELLDVLKALNLFSVWVISYNESSWKPIKEIVELLKKYKNKVVVKSRDYQYNYRKNETESVINKDLFGNNVETIVNKGKTLGVEYLIICSD